MSKVEIRKTGDGSTTLFVPELNETYHSVHGAYNEAMHVFIEKGLRYVKSKFGRNTLSVFELGMGTGLNTLLTLLEAEKKQLKVEYDTIEAYPVAEEVLLTLNFSEVVSGDNIQAKFQDLHALSWGMPHEISNNFCVEKIHAKVEDYELSKDKYDVVYFDAFAPNKQKELWQPAILSKIYSSLINGGVLVTYCAQGQFKRDLKSVGFEVEKVDGPPGKREMIRAIK